MSGLDISNVFLLSCIVFYGRDSVLSSREEEYAEVSSLAIRLRRFLVYVVDVFAYMAFGMVIVGGALVSFVISYFVGYWFTGVGVFIALVIATIVVGKFITTVRIRQRPRRQGLGALVFAISFIAVYLLVPRMFPSVEDYMWYSVLWQLALGIAFIVNGLLVYKGDVDRIQFYVGLLTCLTFIVTAYLLLSDLFLLAWLFAMGSILLVYFVAATLILVKGIRVVTREH